MTGAHSREQRLSTSRILHDMMNLHPKEPRLVQPALAVAVREHPRSLSCTQDPCIRPFRSNRLRHRWSSFSRFLSLKTNERLRKRHLYEEISKISSGKGKIILFQLKMRGSAEIDSFRTLRHAVQGIVAPWRSARARPLPGNVLVPLAIFLGEVRARRVLQNKKDN